MRRSTKKVKLQKLNLTSSFKFKFIVFFFAIVVAISAGITWRSVTGMQEVAMSVFYSQGYKLIKRAQFKVDPEQFQKLAASLDEDDPYYSELHIDLYTLKQESNCKFLYTMVPKGGNNFMYIVDGSARKFDTENFSPLGTVEDLSDYGVYPHKVAEEKDIILSNIRSTKRWGKIITLYAPISNGNEYIGFIACDFDAGNILRLMKKERLIIYALTLFFVVIGIFLIVLYVTKFFKSLNTVTIRMNEIATGASDLTARIKVTEDSEISLLSKACNNIIEKLQNMIQEQKHAVASLSKNSEELLEHSRENSQLIDTATTSISDIFMRAQDQTKMTGEATSTIDDFIESVLHLDEKAGKQIEAIANSSNAVSQISSNIEDVSRQINSISDEYESIVIKSQDGKQKQKEVTEKIAIIQDLAKKLFAANKIISEISSRTNLLAMNAAIEAAHAGTAGQGFSVVATEIRNLAENSAVQTKSIRELVQNVEKAVLDIVEASSKSSSSFDTLAESIRTMESSLQNVNSKMSEQNEESEKIRRMMEVLEDSSKSISASSSRLREKNDVLEENIAALQSKASEILDSSSSATGKLDQMKSYAGESESQSEENLRLSDSVKKLVDSYKTE